MDWMLLPLQRYADFDGRSCRAEYWMFALLQLLIAIACFLIYFVLAGVSPASQTEMSSLGTGLLIFFVLAYLVVFFIPGIAVTIRRWHDLDQSGWFLLLFAVLGAIPILGAIASLGNLIWFCMPGTSGPNKYGDDPLEA
jgi:uncharacterized membrane protein YhaH (DUF805 family)